MSDLISRQDALDAFGLSEKTRKYGGDHSGYDTRMLYEIQDVLEGLPSAQPEQSEPEELDFVQPHKKIGVRLEIGQPEIIRCKDCRHNPKETWFGCPMAHLSEKQRPETAWCWKGERKADKTD